MPIDIHWADTSKTILCYTFLSCSNWEDFHEANKLCWQMIENAKHPVDIILDVSQVDHIPRNTHIHIPNTLKSTPENLNSIIFVGLNAYTRSVKTAMQRLFPHKFNQWRIAWTHDEAMRMIKDTRVHEAVG